MAAIAARATGKPRPEKEPDDVAPGFSGLKKERLAELWKFIPLFVGNNGRVHFDRLCQELFLDTVEQVAGVCNRLEGAGLLEIENSEWLSIPKIQIDPSIPCWQVCMRQKVLLETNDYPAAVAQRDKMCSDRKDCRYKEVVLRWNPKQPKPALADLAEWMKG